MKALSVEGREIKIEEDINLLPMSRYQSFNKFLMLSSEVGSDFKDFTIRTSRMNELIAKKMTKQLAVEFENFRQMVFNAMTNYSPIYKAFACMVAEIDGKKIAVNVSTDEVLKQLDAIGISERVVRETVEEVKKKLTIS